MEQRYKLELVGITFNQIESGVYALILQQEGTSRRIPIVIGFPEAQAIQCKLQEVATPRPLTHDTMAASLLAFGIHLKEVEIKRMPNGVFAADLVFTDGNIEKIVDSRSSDAVALAIRVDAPIFTSAEVLEQAGFDAEESREANKKTLNSTQMKRNGQYTRLSDLSDNQLSELMSDAVEREDYEKAAQIKNEIESRKSKKRSGDEES